MKDITNKLTPKLKAKLTRQEFENSLHRFCRDVDYYEKRGMDEKEAMRYVMYWYGKR